MANESFAFLALYMEDAEDMTAEEKGEYLEAVINYGLYGNEAEHESAAVRIAFRHAKKLIDGANAKKEANKENGAKGGRPPKEISAARKRINELDEKWARGELTDEETKEQEQLYQLVRDWENKRKPK